MGEIGGVGFARRYAWVTAASISPVSYDPGHAVRAGGSTPSPADGADSGIMEPSLAHCAAVGLDMLLTS